MGAQRLYQTTLAFERREGLNNNIQIEPQLWSASSAEEALGWAIKQATALYPGYGMTAQAATDVTDTVRAWVRNNPAENPRPQSEPQASAGSLPPDALSPSIPSSKTQQKTDGGGA